MTNMKRWCFGSCCHHGKVRRLFTGICSGLHPETTGGFKPVSHPDFLPFLEEFEEFAVHNRSIQFTLGRRNMLARWRRHLRPLIYFNWNWMRDIILNKIWPERRYFWVCFGGLKLWWLRELNALQLQKTHANIKSTSKLRKHLYQFDNTCAANAHNTNKETHCKCSQHTHTQKERNAQVAQTTTKLPQQNEN